MGMIFLWFTSLSSNSIKTGLTGALARADTHPSVTKIHRTEFTGWMTEVIGHLPVRNSGRPCMTSFFLYIFI